MDSARVISYRVAMLCVAHGEVVCGIIAARYFLYGRLIILLKITLCAFIRVWSHRAHTRSLICQCRLLYSDEKLTK